MASEIVLNACLANGMPHRWNRRSFIRAFYEAKKSGARTNKRLADGVWRAWKRMAKANSTIVRNSELGGIA